MESSIVKFLFVSYLVLMSTQQGDCSWRSSLSPLSSVFLLGPNASKLYSIKRSAAQKARANKDLGNFPSDFVMRRDYRAKEKAKEKDGDLFLRLF